MARPKKDSITINLRIRRDLGEQLNKYAESTGINKTAVIEKGLELYFSKFGTLLNELETNDEKKEDA
ncbi:MAG: ribbon-helix-helix domain-containing protein [Allobaculum sp.]